MRKFKLTGGWIDAILALRCAISSLWRGVRPEMSRDCPRLSRVRTDALRSKKEAGQHQICHLANQSYHNYCTMAGGRYVLPEHILIMGA